MHIRKNENGSFDPLIVPLIISVFIVIALAVFGVWSYSQYLEQKDNVDEIVAVAVTEAEAVKTEELELDFAEREKSPNKTYVSSSDTGSVKIVYPKNWSAFVDATSTTPLNNFFHPKVVPSDEKNTNYALRVQVVDREYSSELAKFDSALKKGTVGSTPIKKSGEVGSRIKGEIEREVNGVMVMFPLRDKTLKIWTEAITFEKDFNNIVIKNLEFSP